MSALIRSDFSPPIGWVDTKRISEEFGVKAATSLAIPRAWTLPFIIISYHDAEQLSGGMLPVEMTASCLAQMAGEDGHIIVRSSVVGESIWDRGTYDSVIISLEDDSRPLQQLLSEAAVRVLASSMGRRSGLMLQRYVRSTSQGEFGNLLRVAKTRDHWEIATREPTGITSRLRLNRQRDRAADPERPLLARAGLARERLFGAVGAWLNNELIFGRSQRLTCEWIFKDRRFFLVQIDEEDEDRAGINPLQIRVASVIRSSASSGQYLKLAESAVLGQWDKLQVLEQLWEPYASHKPTLFYLPISELPAPENENAVAALTADFADLIGPLGIVVRTSVAAGAENYPTLLGRNASRPMRPHTGVLRTLA